MAVNPSNGTQFKLFVKLLKWLRDNFSATRIYIIAFILSFTTRCKKALHMYIKQE